MSFSTVDGVDVTVTLTAGSFLASASSRITAQVAANPVATETATWGTVKTLFQ